MTTTFAPSLLFKSTRLDQQGRVVLHAGSGDERGPFAIDGAGARLLMSWLLGLDSANEASVAARAAAGMGTEPSRVLVATMIAGNILIPTGCHANAQPYITSWGTFGRRDAADFHQAANGLRSIPDEVDCRCAPSMSCRLSGQRRRLPNGA